MKALDCLRMLALSAALASGLAYLGGCVVDGDDDDAEVEVKATEDGMKIDADD
jgi:hypothetical protein